MEERSDLKAGDLAQAVAGFADGGFGSIECEQQKDGLWRVRAWPEAVLDDDAE
ncbi:MAG: hypothetical protein V2J24_01780 [Pseudomonadales bacterium]|nr:hypothetical protein [Pseudomonadales bacterium]